MDTSYVDTHKSVAVVGTPLPGGYAAAGMVFGNQYKENYYASLYSPVDSLHNLWQGELRVDFDFATPNRYQKIAGNIFDKLLKSGFIPQTKMTPSRKRARQDLTFLDLGHLFND